MKISLTGVLATAALAVSMISANALTVSYSTSIPLSTTNWDGFLTVPQFGLKCTLNQVCVSFNGTVSTIFSVESLDAAPSVITTNSAAMITLWDPANNLIGSVTPSSSSTFNASAFDGSVDFGGTSGSVVGPVTGSAGFPACAVNPGILSEFIGNGSASFPVHAQGLSTATGPGNLLALIQTQASADITVTYYYTCVPEPSSVALIVGFGLSGGALMLRRRRK